MLSSLFERFVEKSPVSVMMRGLMERVFAPESLNELFQTTARVQYTKELLFSDLVELMVPVVCGLQPSVRASYQDQAEAMPASLSLVCLNLLSVLRAALASVHGVDKIEASLSDYYLVNQIQSVYGGMMIAIAPAHWQVFQSLTLAEFAALLQQLAQKVQLSKLLKATRSPKKKQSARIKDRHPHRATARLLNNSPTTP